MECPFCEHPKAHKHSKTSKGNQRYRCPNCHQTFTDSLLGLEGAFEQKGAVIEKISSESLV